MTTRVDIRIERECTQYGEYSFSTRHNPDIVEKWLLANDGANNGDDIANEIQYWDESYDPVGAMFGYHNPVRLVNIESTKYFDMPDSNYGSEWDQFIDAVDNEKDRCLEEARKIVCSK